jgi:two-component system NtrC family sensor kinase
MSMPRLSSKRWRVFLERAVEIYPKHFDREFSLKELLAGNTLERLGRCLDALLGAPYRLTSTSGALLLGEADALAQPRRIPIHHDLEPLGYLESEQADEEKFNAAAALIELMLQVSARYYMAAELHIESVQASYEALKQKHVALQESEASYKALSESLEQRVQQQVQTIETAQRQLYHAEKMASVGQLAAGVAHEINNPIGFIRSNLATAGGYVDKLCHLAALIKAGDNIQLINFWHDADMDFLMEDFGALLKESIDGADRVARIVAELKGFSNVDQAEEEVADLNENIRTTASILKSRFEGQAELKLELGEIPRIMCLPGHLNQLFVNLITNALQAVPRGGSVTVTTDVADDNLRIRVIDNGHGIPADLLQKIFDPFFTTREVGQGTGLGLAVARDVVNVHGGRIEVESQEGIGTTFTVYLPFANPKPATRNAKLD